MSGAHNVNSVKCLCAALTPGIFLCKYTALYPIDHYHENNKCQWKPSIAWRIVSILYMAFLLLYLTFVMKTNNLITTFRHQPIIKTLSSITDVTYIVYETILVLVNVINAGKVADSFNELNRLMKYGLICPSACKKVYQAQIGYNILFLTIWSLQFILICYLHLSEQFNTSFDLTIIVTRFIQFTSYVTFLHISICFTGVILSFLCYEKLLMDMIYYSPIHPMENKADVKMNFLMLVSYTTCKENHRIVDQPQKLSPAEMIEFLRKLHEEICLVMYKMNKAINPLPLLLLTMELFVLVIHWYAIISYMTMEYNSELATINLINCLFTLIHTFGLYFLLRRCQDLSNVVSVISCTVLYLIVIKFTF